MGKCTRAGTGWVAARGLRCAILGVVVLTTSACSQIPSGAGEPTATAQSGITSAPSFAVALPAGVAAGNVAVSADGLLFIQGGAAIRSQNGSAAAVANAGSSLGQTQIGLNASLGSVSSVPSVLVGSGTVVQGNITSAGSIVLLPAARATGTVSAKSSSLTPLNTLSWTAPTPGPASGDVTILSGSTHLVAGNYCNLVVGAGATVTLDRGNYYFCSVNLLPGSVLSFNGPTAGQAHLISWKSC
jgi:hypothetical protein